MCSASRTLRVEPPTDEPGRAPSPAIFSKSLSSPVACIIVHGRDCNAMPAPISRSFDAPSYMSNSTSGAYFSRQSARKTPVSPAPLFSACQSPAPQQEQSAGPGHSHDCDSEFRHVLVRPLSLRVSSWVDMHSGVMSTLVDAAVITAGGHGHCSGRVHANPGV